MSSAAPQAVWHQLEAVFYAALEMRPEDRPRFLDEACGSDAELRRQAEALLAAITKTTGFLERPIAVAAESFEAPSVAAGQRLGAYQILRSIGSGGMGDVYLASRADDSYEQKVAIKVARAPFAVDASLLARFRSERQILADLGHPNIAKLLDGGITPNGLPFLVMEHVDGVPIDVFCENKELNIVERLKIFCAVCHAVEFAHKHLVVHRDIKPSNILVSADGVPKLLDFGIAKLLEPSLKTKSQVGTVDRMMTPEYASPEQVCCEPVTTASDVYALGVLLYKLLTGRLPLILEGTSPLEAAKVITERTPAAPSEVVGSAREVPAHAAPADASRRLRGDLDNITLTALRKEPSLRYSSVAGLAADIEAYFDGYPVKARSASWRYRVGKFVRRHKVGVTSAAVAVLALLGLTITLALERNRANREAEASRGVAEFMTDIFKVSDPSVSHGDTITARELLDRASTRIERGLSKDPRVQARLMRTVGSSYLSLALYPQSVALLERAAAIQAKSLGDRDPETLETMSSLAAAYRGEDRYGEAERLLRRTLAEQQKVMGPENADTMATTDSLADTLTREGRYTEAEGLLRRVLVAQSKSLGPESRAVLFTNNRLVDNLRNQNRFPEAEKLARQSLAVNQRVLGSYDRMTLSSIEELALIVINQGHADEAEKLDREGFRIATHMYGPDNENTLLQLGDIGDALQEEGRFAEAEPIQREVVMRLKKIEGPKARHTIEMMNTLAITLSMEKKFSAGESISREAMAASADSLGAAAVQTIDAMANLALILAYEKRQGESEMLFEKAVAASSKTEGSLKVQVFYAYAQGMAILGQADEAIAQLKQAIDHGFADKQQMASDESLKSLQKNPTFRALVAAMH